MKKFLLTGFVLLTFAIYSFHARHGDLPTIVKAPKTSSGQAGSANSGSTPLVASGNAPSTTYKDGQYVGSIADAFYGNIQIQVTISGGRLTDLKFLQYPSDNPNSQYINSQAMPYLKQEALQAQNANVNIISGATDTSQAFVESLTSALNKAAS